jgi:hypothetical protein
MIIPNVSQSRDIPMITPNVPWSWDIPTVIWILMVTVIHPWSREPNYRFNRQVIVTHHDSHNPYQYD